MCLTYSVIFGILIGFTFTHPTIPEDNLPYYAINPVNLRQLVIFEESLANKLKTYSHTLLGCQEILKEYFVKYTQEIDAVNKASGAKRAEAVSSNGLLMFKFIYRLVKLFEKWNQLSQCTLTKRGYISIWTIIQQEFLKANLSIPSKTDLQDATLGLLRIHYIYVYNASTQLRVGKFGNIDTYVELDFEECMVLASESLAYKAYVLCYQWLMAASEVTTNLEQEDILEQAWTNLSSETNTTVENLRVILQGRIQLGFTPMYPFEEYHACRMDNVNRGLVESLKFGQYCYYQRTGNPYLLLNPVKTEVLTEEPVFVQYYDFIGDETIEFMRNSATNDTYRTIVEKQKEFEEPQFGTYISSVDYELKEDIYYGTEIPSMFQRLIQKVKMVTGLVVQHETAQLMEYGALGGHQDVHHDFLYNTPKKGDRLGHLLFYLTDVTLGGYTAFNLLGVRARPIKGSVILWHNVLRNGEPDYRMYHTGCPVVLGSKQIFRMDLLQSDNVWTFPCDLDPEK